MNVSKTIYSIEKNDAILTLSKYSYEILETTFHVNLSDYINDEYYGASFNNLKDAEIFYHKVLSYCVSSKIIDAFKKASNDLNVDISCYND